MKMHSHATFTTMPFPSSSSKPPLPPPNSSSSSSSSSSVLCKHSPSATLDLLILLLVLFSASFLLTSYLSYIFNSLSLLLHHYNLSLSLPPYSLSFSLFFLISLFFFLSVCNPRSRKCHNPSCKALKKALEFDLQLQTEELVKSKRKDGDFIDKLPWKGGFEGNPDYECLRAELRKMAPVNGRAVLLFRAKCGCPVAKLEGWGPKKARRHKKALANVSANGGDHR